MRRSDPTAKYLLAAGAAAAALVLVGRRVSAAVTDTHVPPRGLADQPPVPADWQRWNGARPEVLGAPENTILAVEGLEKMPAEVRKALLDLAGELGIPVDSIATVIAHESRWKPDALYQAPDNAERRAANKPEFFAAGLVQLTRQAHLPGFDTPEKVRAVSEMSPERQMAEVVAPLWRLHRNAAGASPGKALMLNFMPAHAQKGEDYVLAEEPSAAYTMNRGFDPGGKTGKVTIGSVYASAARKTAFAKGRRLTITGAILDPALPPVGATEASEEPSSTPAVDPAFPPTPDVPAPAPEVAPEAPPAPAPTPAPSRPRGPWPPPPLAPTARAGGLCLAAVRANADEPPIWRTVRWIGRGRTQGLRLDLRVGAHALRAPLAVEGHGTHPLRLPVSYSDVIEICRLRRWIPITQTMSDQAWEQARRLIPRPMGKWDTEENTKATSRAMGTVGWVVMQNANIDAQIPADLWGELWRDEGKEWILHPKIAQRGAVNYGWRRADGSALQKPGGAHDAHHYDYSQVFYPVDRIARDDSGKAVDVIEALRRIGGPLEPHLTPFL